MLASKRVCGLATVMLMLTAGTLAMAQQQDQSIADRAAAAAAKVAGKQKVQLNYKFKIGEVVRWDVEHVATTKTQIAGTHETTSSRTKSRKVWKVSSIDSIGNITFVNSVESTSFWQKIGEADAISFDSEKDKEVPPEFASANDMIGKPLAVVTISPTGKVIDRKSESMSVGFGVGDICVPLPKDPIAIGHRWYAPTVFDATDEAGRRLKLKARVNYELTKIVDGNALITFKTEILTPVESDQVRSQLLQKLTNGFVAFDIAAGRLNTKEVRWNEKVQEYAGADSFLHYNGRMTEQIVTSGNVSKKQLSSAAAKEAKITRPGSKPLIRK